MFIKYNTLKDPRSKYQSRSCQCPDLNLFAGFNTAMTLMWEMYIKELKGAGATGWQLSFQFSRKAFYLHILFIIALWQCFKGGCSKTVNIDKWETLWVSCCQAWRCWIHMTERENWFLKLMSDPQSWKVAHAYFPPTNKIHFIKRKH